MALAVASVASTNFATTLSCTVAKPSSLSVGNLMVAQFTQIDSNGNLQTMTPPTGFTAIRTDSKTGQAQNTMCQLSWKVATSTDVAGSGFTGTMNDSGNSGAQAGGIARITGTTLGTSGQVPTAQNSSSINGGTTASCTFGIAPPDTNSLLLFMVAMAKATSSSGYSVVTSNPTWTEQWNFTAAPNFIGFMAMASAVRTQTTNTGDGNFNLTSGSNATGLGQLISIFYAPAAPVAINSNFLTFM